MDTRPSRHALYHDLFDRLTDPVALIDPEAFGVVDVNDAFYRVLGISSGHAVGRCLLDFVSPSDRPEFEKALRVTRRRHAPRTFEVRMGSQGGDRVLTLELQACVLKLEPAGEVLQLIMRDVTPLRDAESRAQSYLADLKSANQRLESISVTDELTGLANIRQFKREVAKEQERGERYGQPYALIFIDIDHFKKLNDRHGHPAGDRVLRSVAAILKKQARNTDLAARYGGEEFVILCPAVNWEGAMVLAERVRVAILRSGMEEGASQPGGALSVSLGVASFPADGSTVSEVLEAADRALYESKNSGRNRATAAALSHIKKTA